LVSDYLEQDKVLVLLLLFKVCILYSDKGIGT